MFGCKCESGRIGPVVVYDRIGTKVIREYVVPKDPKTDAQLAQRKKLSLANKGLAPLREVIKKGYKDNTKAYNMLIKQVMREFIVGEYPDFSIDYSKIKITEGKLRLPENIIFHTDNQTNSISLSWDTSIANMPIINEGSDKVNLVCLNMKSMETKIFYRVAIRRDGKAEFSLPENWEINDTHIWLYLSSFDFSNNSGSLKCMV